jgi:hypothetical protein
MRREAGTGGGEYSAACPFCGGTDRFRYHPAEGRWLCRGCTGARWADQIDYLARRDRLSTRGAIARLRELAGAAPAPGARPTGANGGSGATARGGPWWAGLRPVGRWAYTDPETGAVLAYHLRCERPHPERPGELEKVYPWAGPDGRVSLGGSIKPAALPLYNASAVLAAPAGARIVVCEGEKAADALHDAARRDGVADRLVAVSLPGGASQVDFGAALGVLAGRDVALWPDFDPPDKFDRHPGEALMRRVALALTRLDPPARVHWLDPPALFPGQVRAKQDA